MITTTPPLARGNTSNDQLRRYNLSMVMTMIHQAGGCTRAELTRRTGLNRSTIAGLVAELVELEMAMEGAPANDLVYLNGSAGGIGGGLVIGGTPLRRTAGYAGELGHVLVNSSGSQCHCGRIGCLETEVSLARLLAVLGLAKVDQDELDVALAVSRDPAVRQEVRRQIDVLAEAISNFVNLFDPEMVVLGGFLGSLLALGRDRLAEAVKLRSMNSRDHEVRIERASLRSRLVMVGVAELVYADLLADPAAFARSRLGGPSS